MSDEALCWTESVPISFRRLLKINQIFTLGKGNAKEISANSILALLLTHFWKPTNWSASFFFKCILWWKCTSWSALTFHFISKMSRWRPLLRYENLKKRKHKFILDIYLWCVARTAGHQFTMQLEIKSRIAQELD